MRVNAPEGETVPDPLFSGYYNDELFEPTFKNTWHSGGWPSLYIERRRGKDEDGYEKTYEFGAYLCAVPEYADGTQPYDLPDEIDGEQAVDENGLYDPKAFAPPHPWYYSDQPMLQPGETREGWFTCQAPDVPLHEIQIRAWFEKKEVSVPIPTIGPFPTPLGPGYTLEESREAADDLSSEKCQEVSIWVAQSDIPTLPPDPTASPDQESTIVAVEAEDNISIVDKIAWDYIQARDFPSEGITLVNVPLRFSHCEDGVEVETIILSGTVTFQTAAVVKVDKRFNDFLFVSRVQVENVDLAQEESQTFRLSGIGAHVEVYNTPANPYINASFGRYFDGVYAPTLYSTNELMTNDNWLAVSEWSHPSPDAEYLFAYQADNPYKGYVFANLDNSEVDLLGYTKLSGGDKAFSPLSGSGSSRVNRKQEILGPFTWLKDTLYPTNFRPAQIYVMSWSASRFKNRTII